MFDLFRSRDKAVRLMLGGLLLVVAVSMLTYLVPNYDSSGPTSNLVVATVGRVRYPRRRGAAPCTRGDAR